MNGFKLMQAGIDYADGLERFSGNAKIYEKYLLKLPDITLIDEMKEGLRKRNAEEAFGACHKMKALIGNLSIPDLYETVCEVTEILRAGDIDHPELEEKVKKIDQQFKTAVKAIEEEAE